MGRNAAAGGHGTLQEVNDMPVLKTHLTTAQLLALATTELPLIPAPGAGKAILLISLFARLNFGGTAFATASGVNASMGPSANGLGYGTVLDPDLITANANKEQTVVDSALGASVGTIAQIENQPVTIKAAAAITTGNGTLDVWSVYQIIST